MIKALIFDVDGTLAETEELHRQSFNTAFASFGLNWHWNQNAYSKLLETTGGKERIASYMNQLPSPRLKPDVVQQIHNRKNDLYAKAVASGGLVLRQGVAQTLKSAQAKGLLLGIATTTSHSNLMALIKHCFSAEGTSLFHTMICGEDVKFKKPHPEVYNHCLEKMHLTAKHVIAFEDSEVGLHAATAAGLATIVTPSAYTQHGTFKGALAIMPHLNGQLDHILSLVAG